jgi:hypothetical protein
LPCFFYSCFRVLHILLFFFLSSETTRLPTKTKSPATHSTLTLRPTLPLSYC